MPCSPPLTPSPSQGGKQIARSHRHSIARNKAVARKERKASRGTLKGAGNDPLIPVLEWIRSTRIGGFEDCTKVAKIARAANLQSSLPSCNLRKRPRCIATTRYDRHNHPNRRNPLDPPSVNRFPTRTRGSRTTAEFGTVSQRRFGPLSNTCRSDPFLSASQQGLAAAIGPGRSAQRASWTSTRAGVHPRPRGTEPDPR
jgi:hypothetical protein